MPFRIPRLSITGANKMQDEATKSVQGVGGASAGDSMFLGRDAILAADDVRFSVVDVPEWGGSVRIKGLTSGERDAFEKSLIKGKGKNQEMSTDNVRAKLLALTIVDSDGRPIFTAADIDALSKKAAVAASRVYNEAATLAGISDADVEELAKNSSSVPADSSS